MAGVCQVCGLVGHLLTAAAVIVWAVRTALAIASPGGRSHRSDQRCPGDGRHGGLGAAGDEGGAGPFSVAGFTTLLSAAHYRVIVPVHPGFDGTTRPAGLTSIAGVADVYAALLRKLDLTGVCVIGNWIGGWIAAELAPTDSAADDSRVSSVVLVDAADSSSSPRRFPTSSR